MLLECVACIEHAACVREAPAFHGQLAPAGPLRLAQDAVDHTAATAAPECQGIASPEQFDALDVVRVPEVLGVVANAIDVEIGGRRIPTDHGCIAMSLALRHRDAGDVARDVTHGLHRLVGQLCPWHDRDGLRYIANLGFGARRTSDASRDISVRCCVRAAHAHRIEHRVRARCANGGRVLRWQPGGETRDGGEAGSGESTRDASPIGAKRPDDRRANR